LARICWGEQKREALRKHDNLKPLASATTKRLTRKFELII
jgi:hypothetical protein